MTAGLQQSRPGRGFGIAMGLLLAAILLFTFAPLISVVVSSWIASSNGCVLNEGGVNPCVIGGVDYGDTLTTMFVAGWFMFLTFPAGIAALLAWLLVLVVVLILRRRRSRQRGVQ